MGTASLTNADVSGTLSVRGVTDTGFTSGFNRTPTTVLDGTTIKLRNSAEQDAQIIFQNESSFNPGSVSIGADASGRFMLKGQIPGLGSGGTPYPVVWLASQQQLYIQTSSRRYKEQIEPLHDDFSKILEIEPKQYVRKESPDLREVGYIAEDLDAAGLQAFTIYDAEGRPDGVDYSRLIVYANEILKSQRREIQSLKSELETLKSTVLELSRRQR